MQLSLVQKIVCLVRINAIWLGIIRFAQDCPPALRDYVPEGRLARNVLLFHPDFI